MPINARKALGMTLLVSLAMWIFFSWPLPRHIASGIPSSSKNTERANARTMIPGDHLQLMYYFWLAGDMAAGHTPLFHNLYEFNAGDDAQTRRVHHYYIPFSLIFGLLASLAPRALAWNATAWFSFWLTYYFTFLLVRRYTREDLLAGIAALVALLIPFRWMQWTGGSPTGFGLAWVPALFLGLDLAVRETRLAGGLLAGAALLLTRLSDSHLFYFSFWAAPCWCLFAFLNPQEPRRWSWREGVNIVKALLPVPFFVAAGLAFSLLTHLRISESIVAEGRSMREILLYSPLRAGLVSWADLPRTSNQIYIGFVPLAIALGGLGVLLWRGLRRRSGSGRALWPLLLAVLGFTAVVLLALGPHDPFNGALFRAARKILPQYKMIRQPAKAFSLAGPVLSLATGLGLAALLALVPRPRARTGLALLAAALITAEYRGRLTTTVCLLDQDQPAYAAVAADAAARQTDPRALVLPLWPGDAAWSSIYQYYASLYRIRMVNGYHPVISQTYFDDVFLRFVSANKGDLTGDQLDELLSRGIHHILLHEDLFPEKVSPFPVAVTIKRLLDHPRLEFLCQSDAVWAFRIRHAAGAKEPAPALCDGFFPARRWELEEGHNEVSRVEDPAAGGGMYVVLDKPGMYAVTRPGSISAAPDLRWMIRVRGDGILAPQAIGYDFPSAMDPVVVRADDWMWKEVPYPIEKHSRTGLRLDWAQGRVEADMAILAAGPWHPPTAGETLELPAPCFFHAGYTDTKRGVVVFDADRVPRSTAFYGPKLPFDPGHYEVEMVFSSDTAAGTVLGRLNVRQEEGDESGSVPVIAGRPARLRYIHADNLPLMLAFRYERTADMAIEKVVFRRVE
ncbi:MAG: hypothetical protein JXB04_06035 [Kiritimatiellae bacterium]|nr:hypothetical protein [Kiritimatiellia bacterium]